MIFVLVLVINILYHMLVHLFLKMLALRKLSWYHKQLVDSKQLVKRTNSLIVCNTDIHGTNRDTGVYTIILPFHLNFMCYITVSHYVTL